jgi:hypothetical protein
VFIKSGFVAGDILSGPDQNGFQVGFDSTNGTAIIFDNGGVGTLAAFQAELRLLTFTTSNADVTAGPRTIDWRFIDDNRQQSNDSFSTVVTVPGHTATVAVGATATYTERQASSVIIEGAASFTDSDPISQVQIALPASQFLNGIDMLGFQSGSGIRAASRSV